MKKQTKVLILSATVIFLGTFLAQAAAYKIDPVHSVVGFKIDHLMVSKVWGRFNSFSGEIIYGQDVQESDWKLSAVIDAKSVDTGNVMRDEHLRGKDFFNVAEFPEIRFKAVKMAELKEKDGLHYGKLLGALTLLGVTRPIILTGKVNGIGKGMKGEKRIGFEASASLNRQDFGMKWSQTLDGGGLALGNQVEVFLQIEAVQE